MRPNKGFTLVELMIVVLILGALATIAIPRIIGGSTTAKVNACKANIALLNSKIELYYATEGVWPSSLADVEKDPNYFPDGEPQCPISGGGYPNTLTDDHRVKTIGHTH
jgi:prepilin-type N-terminal cleavage/methylation domain-containing protein